MIYMMSYSFMDRNIGPFTEIGPLFSVTKINSQACYEWPRNIHFINTAAYSILINNKFKGPSMKSS